MSVICKICGVNETDNIDKICKICRNIMITYQYNDFITTFGESGSDLHSNLFHAKIFENREQWRQKKEKINSYLDNKKGILLYPGTRTDVFTPLKFLNSLIEEFYFVDGDMSFSNSILKLGFKYLLKNEGFTLHEIIPKVENGINYTYCKIFYKRKPIIFRYYHTKWQKLIESIEKEDKKISFLYIYAKQDGEGGTGFTYAIDNQYSGRNEYKQLSSILKNKFVCIDNENLLYGEVKRSLKLSKRPSENE